MSRRLTEERFATACANATSKINALVTGKKQCLIKSKKVIVIMLEEHRNIDAKKEAKDMIYNQYLVDIYEVLVKMINTLVQHAATLPRCGLVPRSLDVEIRSIVFFSERLEDIKELTDIKKMFVGQFGTTLIAETTEDTIDQRLYKKYRNMNNISEKIVNNLLDALKPKEVQPENQKGFGVPTTDPVSCQQHQFIQSQQQNINNNYSRFASMNQDNNRFPTFEQQEIQQNQFPSMGNDNKLPSFEPTQPQQNQFSSMCNDNKFPSFEPTQPQQNQFPTFNTPTVSQQNTFPSFDQPIQQNTNKFPSFNQTQEQSQQFQSIGTFAPIPNSNPVCGSDDVDDLLSRMNALKD
ncbi:hypothetical protein EHI8A_002380 [Entamoeba histolytica HM-1:IMSS-B]|uniref:Uncharacterized protein n=6 Tax=Entamoeba histolytica TaxID=5759 RepID=C4M0Y9_ENTH1|nr:hypothetical protein EHI_135020 [Entamoeba histolytica HM-1:IMSS]EMD48600.1 Hypothetical protein EHI5A_009550 [Entamoeba histolytica KU27]EMH76439.1 hypothetical protein EHI8A_002380 [Entamoeba histolytica HM-1:IMSS-B]EMS14492.1 hypothetical protein KM1_008220 [Entamoeba histolytica HM-3:IMSS]ENY61279.1 hypothetical protein EHI7A_018060 [Entamoeba histolytica HM-1:IMSS-A]GAT94846.1 hypothetical protein CL6EHI_135020 [Entamoeba histolytica]|eukprot:XP_651664.1 hypothetical protein EHI_135020 [Entamoeba histolytica HM-1:IMSS]